MAQFYDDVEFAQLHKQTPPVPQKEYNVHDAEVDSRCQGLDVQVKGGIIDMLEVIESDFTKGISEMVAAEQTADALFDKETKENAVEKPAKSADIKYKNKEAASLDKKAAELSTDIEGAASELAAVNDFEMVAAEQTAAAVYDTETKENAA